MTLALLALKQNLITLNSEHSWRHAQMPRSIYGDMITLVSKHSWRHAHLP